MSQKLPVIYLNNKKGSLVRLDTTGFPEVPALENYRTYGFVDDVDGDGIEDLVYFKQFSTYSLPGAKARTEKNLFLRFYKGVNKLELPQ